MVSIQELLNQYHFSITPPACYPAECICALGMGDILLRFIILRDRIINPPLVFNLSFFTDATWYPNPDNALQFRLRLIRELIQSIPVSESDLIFSFINCNQYQHVRELKLINRWDLVLPAPQFPVGKTPVLGDRKYVIFHTKYRVVYHKLQDPLIFQKIRRLFKDLKLSNHDIVLMGEQVMVDTWEKNFHIISTIYEDLKQLRNNNKVYDLTRPSIYNSLDYDQYLRDCQLIKRAEKNILIGYSGQLCTCLSFNQPSVLCLVIEPYDGLFNSNLNNNMIFEFSKFEQKMKEL